MKTQSIAELLVARGYVQADDLERVALVISQAQAAPKAESIIDYLDCSKCKDAGTSACLRCDGVGHAPKSESAKCPKCNGDGYTSEHSPALNAHDGGGNCLGDCPMQVQCESCEGTGRIKAPKAESQSTDPAHDLLVAIRVNSFENSGLYKYRYNDAIALIEAAFAAQRQAGREEAWKESAKHTIEFGEICIYPLDGESIDHGFGVNLFNYGKGHDHSWEFNYCPWCGKKIMGTGEAPETDAARERRVDLCTSCQNTGKVKV